MAHNEQCNLCSLQHDAVYGSACAVTTLVLLDVETAEREVSFDLDPLDQLETASAQSIFDEVLAVYGDLELILFAEYHDVALLSCCEWKGWLLAFLGLPSSTNERVPYNDAFG
jgi:hypothetical protein